MVLGRTGDSFLKRAALRINQKIDGFQDEETRLHVAPWGA